MEPVSPELDGQRSPTSSLATSQIPQFTFPKDLVERVADEEGWKN
jgi:hypothetical protein